MVKDYCRSLQVLDDRDLATALLDGDLWRRVLARQRLEICVEGEREATHLGLSLGSSDRVRRRVDLLQFLQSSSNRFDAEEAGKFEPTQGFSCGQDSRDGRGRRRLTTR